MPTPRLFFRDRVIYIYIQIYTGGLCRDNGKENGSYYLRFRVRGLGVAQEAWWVPQHRKGSCIWGPRELDSRHRPKGEVQPLNTTQNVRLFLARFRV